MPADFDTSATFGDIVLNLAEEVGLVEYDATTNEAKIPDDAESLRVLRARVNEGLKQFARMYPKWTRLEHRVQITLDPNGTGPLNIDKDAARYRLPGFITSKPKGNWTFVDSSSAYSKIIHCSWDIVRAKIALGDGHTGTPVLAAMAPYQPESGDDRQGFEVLFWPAPTTSFTVEAEFRVQVQSMTDLGERHPFGAEHDLAILKCAVEAFRRRDDEDPDAYNRALVDRNSAVAESIALDQQLEVPTRLGQMVDPSLLDGQVGDARRYLHPGTTQVNGVDVATTAF